MDEDKIENSLPKWLRYLLIVALIFSIVATAFKIGGPPRSDFPSHMPKR